ncbi:MAG: RcpC/CpaB family pilus assembly protein [Acidimicrobiales bacterium]
MKRRIGGVIASLLLATLGTFALVSYVQSAKDNALAGEALVDVLVVTGPVAKGTPVGDLAGLVRTERVPVKVKAAGSVDSLTALEDLVAGVDLVAGEQVVAARFVTAQVAGQQADVPKDKLQVTVALDPVRAVGGQVRAGDLVAVVASFGGGAPGAAPASDGTHLILHKVVVTSVQVEQKPPENDPQAKPANDRTPTQAPTGNLLITLALDAPSVERIVFAAERGTLWLALEPTAAPEGGTKIVTPGNVF